MRTVTKKEVTRRTTRLLGEKGSVAELVVDGVFNAMREIMMNADPEVRIEIRDFGVFEVKKTNPKPSARNPRTGDRISVPPRKKTHFKPGKILKAMLKQPLE